MKAVKTVRVVLTPRFKKTRLPHSRIFKGGKIRFTIYPGYLVGDRVFEKALVLTVPEEETQSAEAQSENQKEIEGAQPLH